MPNVPGLRSPYAKVGRLVYFGRMLDKLRLHAAGQLPPDYVPNLGKGFDSRCCTFLRVGYDDLKTHVLAHGGLRSDDECEIWNNFLSKRGWRDDAAAILVKRLTESGLAGTPALTLFDYLDFDEGRDPVAARAWEA